MLPSKSVCFLPATSIEFDRKETMKHLTLLGKVISQVVLGLLAAELSHP